MLSKILFWCFLLVPNFPCQIVSIVPNNPSVLLVLNCTLLIFGCQIVLAPKIGNMLEPLVGPLLVFLTWVSILSLCLPVKIKQLVRILGLLLDDGLCVKATCWDCTLVYLSDPSPIIGYACHSLTDWLTHSLTHSLLFRKLDWCDPGVWRCQLKTCWGC